MALIIGDLRYSIKIKQLTATKDDYGSATNTYTDLMTLRSGVKFVSGTQKIDSKEIFNSQVIQFTTHYRSAIENTMRIEFEAKQYRILSIDVIGFKEGLILNAELIND